MGTRKPSLTKQIGEALGTGNKVEQLERLNKLLQMVETPVVAVTVLFSKGRTQVVVASERKVSPDDVKFILQNGVDEITRQVVEFDLEQKAMAQPPPPNPLPETGIEEPEEDYDPIDIVP